MQHGLEQQLAESSALPIFVDVEIEHTYLISQLCRLPICIKVEEVLLSNLQQTHSNRWTARLLLRKEVDARVCIT